MTTDLKNNLKDVDDLYSDIAAGKVPAVAYVRPLEQMAGHPANATIALYENFVTNLVNMVHDQPDLWKSTAILITVDEGEATAIRATFSRSTFLGMVRAPC